MPEVINWEKDNLTKCYTRNALYPFLEKLRIENSVTKKPFSLILLDLNHFKVLNDRHGHLFGDEALRYFSSTLRLSLEGEPADSVADKFVFRLGGDEFIIAFPGRTSAQVYPIAVNIFKIIKNRNFLFMGRVFKMSFSGGIATFPNDADTTEKLIENADKAMYFSKKSGFSKITQYSDISMLRSKRLWVLFSTLIITALFSLTTLRINISVKKVLENLVFIDKIFKTDKIKKLRKSADLVSPDMKTVYFKSGGTVRGIIIKDGDPIEFKVIFEQGEATMLIRKAEVLKIE